jgi:hypothetical protein
MIHCGKIRIEILCRSEIPFVSLKGFVIAEFPVIHVPHAPDIGLE